MTQNIYDDAAFFAAYSGLRRSVEGLDGAPEWPALQALLPPLQGRRVLDLGCGFGWFCRWARAQGAASVLGLDLSERMLAQAGSMTKDAAISYARADLESLDLPEAGFDLAFSSLAFHYVADLAGLLATVRRGLVPGGHLVLSMEHPVFTAPLQPGWLPTPEGGRRWPIDSYQREGARMTDWLGSRVVKQHRTLGTVLTQIIRAGFTLAHVEDWGPTDAQVAARPELAEERERPIFLLLAAQRPGVAPG